MKNNQHSHFRYLLLFCITLFLFASCSKPETDTGSPPSDTEPAAGILSDLFSETVCEIQENVWLANDIIPYYDTESQTITTLLTEIEEIVGEDDVITETRTGCLYTFDHNGRVLDKTYIPLKEGAYIRHGMVLEQTVIYTTAITTKNYQEFTLHHTDLETLETVSVDFDPDLGWESEYDIRWIAVDSEERVYCTDRETVLVLNPDLTTTFTYDFPNTIYIMARGADGNIWVTFSAGMESCAATIDPDTKMLGTYHTFTRGMDLVNKPLHYLLGAAIPSGDSDYSFFYYDMSSEVWGVTVEEDGSITETRVIDLFNSGISQLWVDEHGVGPGLVPIAFLTDDLFLTRRYAEDGSVGSIFVLLNRADNVDISEQTVLTIAYAYAMSSTTVEHIIDFKRTRPDLRIVLEDYSTYATPENLQAGEEKLCFDIVNGFVQPDIVVTDASFNTLRDNMIMTQLYRNNLYIDLVPYLEQDDTLNFDNLFGCIRRLFDDGKGGMWGITTDFTVDILYGSSMLLGEYTEKESWMVSEMLDFLSTLPEDTDTIFNYNRKQGHELAQGFAYFINDGTCSFDSEEFIRYLEFYKTVPATPADWNKVSPAAEIKQLPAGRISEAVADALAAGKIALNRDTLSYRYLHDQLFSDDTYPIGFPTKNDSGFIVKADTVYVITSFAEEPDLCFELLKSFFVCETKSTGSFSLDWPFFARKDHFEETLIIEMTPDEVQLMTDEEYKAYCKEHGMPYSSRSKAPGPMTEEERAATYEIFDRMGSPIMEETPEAVADIVNEEISVFLSGMGTAEDCAKKIQSRVEIWLAEHE